MTQQRNKFSHLTESIALNELKRSEVASLLEGASRELCNFLSNLVHNHAIVGVSSLTHAEKDSLRRHKETILIVVDKLEGHRAQREAFAANPALVIRICQIHYRYMQVCRVLLLTRNHQVIKG